MLGLDHLIIKNLVNDMSQDDIGEENNKQAKNEVHAKIQNTVDSDREKINNEKPSEPEKKPEESKRIPM